MTCVTDIATNSEAKELQMFIDGRWVSANSGKTFEVRNPATGDLIGLVQNGDAYDTSQAIDAAAKAFPSWARLPAKERAAYLMKVSDLMLERKEELARLVAIEEAKPIVEARVEIQYSAEFLRFFAEECKRNMGEVIPSHMPAKRLLAIKQPVGVAGIITIWNYPSAGITRPVAPALAAGCTVVVKPAEQTPLSAIAIFEIFEEAGLPHGVANLVTALNPEVIGQELLTNPLIRKLNFTGSIEVGKRIMRGASDQLKRITLELGGHAPFIVFEDADIKLAAYAAMKSKFQNSGQTCVALNRIYVHESIIKPFISRFTELVKILKMGNPLDETVQIGPLIDRDGLQKVENHVEDALSRGAKLLIGGNRRKDNEFSKGFFFEPTVLSNVTHDMLIMREETFGPVAPVVTFASEDDVLSHANELPYGLAAFFYTRDLSRAIHMAEHLEYGIVGINDYQFGSVQIPFGGVKQSGYGKEGGRLGLEEFLETKLISIGL
ncbi:MAG: NAD-dependent succinate-semialdehyde dehydrogenase [Thermodesulfobacteriota bacterium]